ncbi:hypothetical protein LUZ60_014211 [Juncus effusus]|nr:hypothetical protein LUZ60_014211 [Juncus effusus]
MADAVASAFMQIILKKLSATLIDQLKPPPNVHNQLDNLNGTLTILNAFLEDAEAKHLQDTSIKDWLAKLKNVFYDVDDLLDDCYTRSLQSKSKGQVSSNKFWDKIHVGSPSRLWHNYVYSYSMERKICSIQERLGKIAREREVLGLQMLSGMRKPEIITQLPPSSSLVDSSMVFGRENDRNEIVKLLLSDNGSNISVVPVVGMGGIGKTTLVQMVYHDKMVKEYFEITMWIYVSENFDELRLTKETLEAVVCECDQSFVTTNMNLLQETLSGMLRGKRYLLVLDDVWNEDHEKWHSYRSALVSGRKGSKIIVTTRNENVGRIMEGVAPYKLQQLSDDDCWELFKRCAFSDGDCSAQPKLEGIGKEMIKKLKGLPLASKALGRLLYCKADEDEWKEILRSEIWEIPEDKNHILPALTLSYKHLPPHLKQCFAFCSIFHRDYIFEKDKLVQIWVAEGFIRPQGNKRLEDIGNSYFNELLSRSFFQPYEKSYVMHDAMHDLAKSISLDDCGQLEDHMRHDNRKKVRHLSFSYEQPSEAQFEQLYGLKGLRTLLLMHGYGSNLTRLPNALFLKLKTLRVLDLHRRRIEEIPDSIGNLLQLRFLDITNTLIKALPNSITKLLNLQTLRLQDCNLLKELPYGITNLINLRHLEASVNLVSTIAGIGTLVNLQELKEFIVSKYTGYKIIELKNLNVLREHLCIKGLENVADADEANEARLCAKENLRVLHLIWEENRNGIIMDDKVLENMKPHTELKDLMIKGYASKKFPTWIGSSSFSDLQSVLISNCMSSELPSLGQLPFLQFLDICGTKEVARLGPEFSGMCEIRGFPSLKELLLEDMPKLVEWTFEHDTNMFPQLISLVIINCPQLKELPPLPRTLTRLRIIETGLTSLPKLQNPSNPSSLTSLYINDCPVLTSLRKGLLEHDLTFLTCLTVANCEELVSLPKECFRHLTSLRILNIYNCPYLVPWTTLKGGLLPSLLEDVRLNSCPHFAKLVLNGLKHLAHLQHFEIGDCPEVDEFPPDPLPLTLSFLEISDCEDLQSFPPYLYRVSSLQTLIVSNCPDIMCFPKEGLPRELNDLYVKRCPSLTRRCQVGGPDRIKITHVKNVEIDDEVIMSEW